MARDYQTLRRHVLATRAVVSVLVVLVYLWTACSLPDTGSVWPIYGLLTCLVILGLYGLWESRKMVFLSSSLILIMVHVTLMVAASIRTIEQVLTESVLLLITIYLIELGNSSIFFNHIVHNMKEPAGRVSISQTTKALTRYFINLTSIVTATFLLSFLLFIPCAIASSVLIPSYVVAVAIVVLLTSFVLLGAF